MRDVTGWVPAAMIEYVGPASPATASAEPARSSRGAAVGLRDSGICRMATAITATATTGLIRNTHRQDPAWISQPPRNAAIAVVIPLNADQTPIAAARSSATKLDSRTTRLAA